MFADLPGYGFARVPERIRATWKPLVEGYLESRETLRGVVVILDARRGIGSEDEQLIEFVARCGRPSIVVANKIDKLRQAEKSRLQRDLSAARPGLPAVLGHDGRGRARALAPIDRARRGSLASAGGQADQDSGAGTARARSATPRSMPGSGCSTPASAGSRCFKELARRLPREHLLYLGDTARLPYGSKSPETVTSFAIEVGDFFAERGVKLMVVACNTTSAVALETLRARYDIPVLGVIAPGARAAVAATSRGRIGVIGTEATIASGAYEREIRTLAPTSEVFARACPLFVPLAEEGWLDNDVARRTIALYLASLKKSGIDALILGCTHYPLLRPAIADFIGRAVRIVDSAEETAGEVRRVLREQGLLRPRGPGAASFFVTDAVQRFLQVGERFYGASVASAVRVVLRGEPPRATPRIRTRA